MAEEYWRWTATEAVTALKSGDVSPTELIGSAVERIEAVDGEINALPLRCADRALAQAKELESGPAVERGLLGGLPVAIRTTTTSAV